MHSLIAPTMSSINAVGARVRLFFPEILGTTVSTTGALASWQVHTQWLFSVAAAVVGLIAGLLTIRSLLKKSRH
jgi:uncharacterized membrane protein YccC